MKISKWPKFTKFHRVSLSPPIVPVSNFRKYLACSVNLIALFYPSMMILCLIVCTIAVSQSINNFFDNFFCTRFEHICASLYLQWVTVTSVKRFLRPFQFFISKDLIIIRLFSSFNQYRWTSHVYTSVYLYTSDKCKMISSSIIWIEWKRRFTSKNVIIIRLFSSYNFFNQSFNLFVHEWQVEKDFFICWIEWKRRFINQY